MKGDHGIFDGNGAFFPELPEGTGHGFTGGAGHGSHLFVREKQRETIAAVDVLADLVREFEEEASEASSDRFGESDAACILERKTVFLADALNSSHLSFAMIAQEGEEPFPFDGTKLRGREGFG